jgi:3-isopropylmalate dehydrogenase
MKADIVLIPGDGIGPEIVAEAKKVLKHTAEKHGHDFSFTEIDMGGCSIDKYGVPLTDEALAKGQRQPMRCCSAQWAEKWEAASGMTAHRTTRPEAGLLKIRKELGLFANLRPAYLYPELSEACPLKGII